MELLECININKSFGNKNILKVKDSTEKNSLRFGNLIHQILYEVFSYQDKDSKKIIYKRLQEYK